MTSSTDCSRSSRSSSNRSRLRWAPSCARPAGCRPRLRHCSSACVWRPRTCPRRGEVESVAAALARHLEVRRLSDPARLEGGDVLRVGRELYVGLTRGPGARTNAAGIAQLGEALKSFGYAVQALALHGCLHLK